MGIIFDIKRFAVHDGPGIRTTVFLKGCPLKCVWCHNPEGINPLPEPMQTVQHVDGGAVERQVMCGRELSADDLMNEILSDHAFFEQSGGGVTFSGGEPAMQYGFLIEVIMKCRRQALHVCLDTSGHFSYDYIQSLITSVNLFLYDLKIMDNDKHARFTGSGNQVILNNLTSLHDSCAEVIIRFPLIPGINDDDDNLYAMIEYLRLLPRFRRVDILPYHDFGQSKYRKLNKEKTFSMIQGDITDRTEQVRQKLSSAGFDVRVGG